MAIRICDMLMTSDQTPRTAEYREHAAANGRGAWIVHGDPRLTGRLPTRNEAITAMTLAEAEAAGQGGSPHAAASSSQARNGHGLFAPN